MRSNMIYVLSDLHGTAPKTLKALLDKAGFSEDDTLFLLGDSIDRGQYGIELLLYLMDQPNIYHLMGNHEAMLLAVYDLLLAQVTEESIEALTPEKLGILSTMLANGAQPTLDGLKKLSQRDPETALMLRDYLCDMPLYDSVEVGDRTYLLVHAGLGGYEKGKKLSAYSADDLTWHRPEKTEQYDFGPDVTVLFGHTPTSYYGTPGKIFKNGSWWCIDTSDVSPTLIRLDDGAVFT